MAEAVGGGIDAAVSRGALQVVVAIELRLRAVPIVPLLVTVGTRGIAGEGVAAGVAGVVAVRLQEKPQLLTRRRRTCPQHQERITGGRSGMCLVTKLQ